jgi:prepilin-type processing-associated H-X9-DG protein
MNRSRTSAFTKWDLLICLATVAMLGIALPILPFHRHRACGHRLNCVSNLKQIGLGFRMWSNDHEERMPWQLPAAEGGTKEFAHSPYAALHFTLVSNEFNSPKILTCPSDTNRTRTSWWDAPLSGLSYFAGISANETNAASFLSGDRNISTNSSMLSGLLAVRDPAAMQWTGDIHKRSGHIAFADGSVAQLNDDRLRQALQSALDTSVNGQVRLAVP